MLARLDPRHLGRLWFPLGDQTKDETRAEAERAGLRVARRRDSQEACFLGGGDYRDFLLRHGLEREEGDVVDEDGRMLGRHGGFWGFTPGQRRGLGVAAGAARVRAPCGAGREHGGRRRRATRSRGAPSRPTAGSTRTSTWPRRSSATGRLPSARTSSARTAGSSCGSPSRRTASPRGRRPCSTRTTPW